VNETVVSHQSKGSPQTHYNYHQSGQHQYNQHSGQPYWNNYGNPRRSGNGNYNRNYNGTANDVHWNTKSNRLPTHRSMNNLMNNSGSYQQSCQSSPPAQRRQGDQQYYHNDQQQSYYRSMSTDTRDIRSFTNEMINMTTDDVNMILVVNVLDCDNK
jgi:hypothetical protein